MSGGDERVDGPGPFVPVADRVGRALRHDLKNPLAVVLGRCEMLISGALGELEERQLRSVRIIHRNAHRMVEMLDELAALMGEPGGSGGDGGAPPAGRSAP